MIPSGVTPLHYCYPTIVLLPHNIAYMFICCIFALLLLHFCRTNNIAMLLLYTLLFILCYLFCVIALFLCYCCTLVALFTPLQIYCTHNIEGIITYTILFICTISLLHCYCCTLVALLTLLHTLHHTRSIRFSCDIYSHARLWKIS